MYPKFHFEESASEWRFKQQLKHSLLTFTTITRVYNAFVKNPQIYHVMLDHIKWKTPAFSFLFFYDKKLFKFGLKT